MRTRLLTLAAVLTLLLLVPIIFSPDSNSPLAGLCPDAVSAQENPCAAADATIAEMSRQLEVVYVTNEYLMNEIRAVRVLPTLAPSPLPPVPFDGVPPIPPPAQTGNALPPFLSPAPSTAVGMILTPTRNPDLPTLAPIVTRPLSPNLNYAEMTATAIYYEIFGGTIEAYATETSVIATLIASSATPQPPDYSLQLDHDPIFTEVDDCEAQSISGSITGLNGREVLVRVQGDGLDRVRLVTDDTPWEIPVVDEPTAATYTVTVLTVRGNQVVAGPVDLLFDDAACAAVEVNWTVVPHIVQPDLEAIGTPTIDEVVLTATVLRPLPLYPIVWTDTDFSPIDDCARTSIIGSIEGLDQVAVQVQVSGPEFYQEMTVTDDTPWRIPVDVQSSASAYTIALHIPGFDGFVTDDLDLVFTEPCGVFEVTYRTTHLLTDLMLGIDQ